MKKQIATLQSAPPESVEVPAAKGDSKRERLHFGAIRLFPGVPKALSEDELAWIESERPDLWARLVVRKYVESQRVDGRRGASEADLAKLAEAEGLTQLPLKEQVRRLRDRGKLPLRPSPPAKKAGEPKKADRSKKSTTREPR